MDMDISQTWIKINCQGCQKKIQNLARRHPGIPNFRGAHECGWRLNLTPRRKGASAYAEGFGETGRTPEFSSVAGRVEI
jgi:hypothetical protein